MLYKKRHYRSPESGSRIGPSATTTATANSTATTSTTMNTASELDSHNDNNISGINSNLDNNVHNNHSLGSARISQKTETQLQVSFQDLTLNSPNLETIIEEDYDQDDETTYYAGLSHQGILRCQGELLDRYVIIKVDTGASCNL